MSAEDGGSNSGIMLVASPDSMRAPSRDNYPYVLGRDRAPRLGPAASPAAKTANSSESRLSRGNSESDKDLSRSDSVQEPETKSKSPLLSNGHRRTIGSYSGELSDVQSPPSSGGTSLFGPGGILSPRRVQMLLLLQCLVVVSVNAKGLGVSIAVKTIRFGMLVGWISPERRP